jgi:hypothetical protein
VKMEINDQSVSSSSAISRSISFCANDHNIAG